MKITSSRSVKSAGILALGLTIIVSGCAKQTSSPLAASSSSTATTADSTKSKTVVKVGINNLPNPPYSFVDDKNQPVGYTIDYLKELEKKLPEYKFDYEAVDSDSQLIGTDSGKYAFAANYYFRNPEREKKYIFNEHEFGYSVTALAVKADRNDIISLDDLVGKKLVPMTPTSGLRYIIKDYNIKHPGKEIKIEDIDKTTISDDLKLVDSGKYEADFINVHNFDDVNQKLKLNLKIGGVISKEPIWVLFNKNQSELAKKVDAATLELINDGTLSKFAEKWFKVDFFKSIEFVKQGYQFRTTN
ncbi:transporter substrate-binding domain-containing protein [Paenibacillus sp. SI8]|uniref:transporter substrate-binding domain-containing protein n=1 Tax=unclassified Paenibacillus TaxID=185978 RepID=UPI0034665066